MREILFRAKTEPSAKDGTTGKVQLVPTWIYGYIDLGYMRGEDGAIISDTKANHAYRCQYATIGQYTGLTDKNGKKIFEGDIVRYAIYPPDQFVHGVVNYKDGVYRIGDQGCALCVCAADGIEEYRLEVIGNIHDNPELLQQHKNPKEE